MAKSQQPVVMDKLSSSDDRSFKKYLQMLNMFRHCIFNYLRASSVQSRHQLPATGLDGPWLESWEDIPGCAPSGLPGKGPHD
jgi:hypothetical protein